MADTTKKPEAERDREEPLTAAPSSVEEEREPEFAPQSPGEVARKIEVESEDSGIGDKARAGLEEADREVSGDYERRQEEAAREQPVTGEEPKQARP